MKFVSLMAEDSVAAATPVQTQTINLNVTSPTCTITQQESATMPSLVRVGVDISGDADASTHRALDLDQATNGVVPDIVNGYNGTLLNGAVLAPGINGNALSLNGLGACMEVRRLELLADRGKPGLQYFGLDTGRGKQAHDGS